jgi:hypothetical protein
VDGPQKNPDSSSESSVPIELSITLEVSIPDFQCPHCTASIGTKRVTSTTLDIKLSPSPSITVKENLKPQDIVILGSLPERNMQG